jgi:septal ring factor EnvC (AmiA/AmiB activator)
MKNFQKENSIIQTKIIKKNLRRLNKYIKSNDLKKIKIEKEIKEIKTIINKISKIYKIA